MGSCYKLTAILFGFGVTLHNLEEAMYWPGWVRSHLKLFFEPNRKIYWILTSLISVVIWIPIVGVCVSPGNSHFHSVLSGIALAVAVNAVLPHLAAWRLSGNRLRGGSPRSGEPKTAVENPASRGARQRAGWRRNGEQGRRVIKSPMPRI
jgi:hypothetical protein